METRYRNKLGKIVVELKIADKWLYVKTLSDPIKDLNQECLDKVSFLIEQNKQKEAQKFSQSALTDVSNKDTEEEKLRIAKENRDKLMKEMLG